MQIGFGLFSLIALIVLIVISPRKIQTFFWVIGSFVVSFIVLMLIVILGSSNNPTLGGFFASVTAQIIAIVSGCWNVYKLKHPQNRNQ